MQTNSIHIQHLSLAYEGKQIFNDLSLAIPENKWLAILGESGIGKSTLLRLIAGLPMSSCSFTGEIHKQDVSYMAQIDLLLPWLSVLDNVLLSVKLKKYSRAEIKFTTERARKLLCDVDLGDCLHLYPHQLSGGMRQRVALIRTLLDDKSIVLMDEPFSALDVITRQQLQNFAANLLRNKTVVFITHDPTEALRLADVIYVMRGKPAKLHLAMELSTKTPRNINEISFTEMYRVLMNKLTYESI